MLTFLIEVLKLRFSSPIEQKLFTDCFKLILFTVERIKEKKKPTIRWHCDIETWSRRYGNQLENLRETVAFTEQILKRERPIEGDFLISLLHIKELIMIVIIRKALFPKFTYITALLRVFESDEFLLLSNPHNLVVEQVFSVLFNHHCSGDQSEKSHLLNYAQRSVTETTLQLVHFASRCNYNYGKFERLYVIYSH